MVRATVAYSPERRSCYFAYFRLVRQFAIAGVPIYVTEKILNFASGAIGGIAVIHNRHSDIDEMREVVELNERFVGGLVEAYDWG